jgi:hypothetical protein
VLRGTGNIRPTTQGRAGNAAEHPAAISRRCDRADLRTTIWCDAAPPAFVCLARITFNPESEQ